jgi:hypothetical protein
MHATLVCADGEVRIMPYQSGILLNKHPCAQCGKPIASPLWSEHERNRVSFLWSCKACDYQFVTIAILKPAVMEVRVPQPPPVPEVAVHDGPAIAA